MRRWVRTISDAIKIGDLSVGKDISLEAAPLLSSCEDCGRCDLFIYALSHSEEIAFDLLQSGYKLNGYQGLPHHGYPYTALHMCTEKEQFRLLNAILDKQPELLFLDTEVHPVHLSVLNHQNACLIAMLDRSETCWASIRARHDNLSPGVQTLLDEIGARLQRKDSKFRLLESSDLSIILLRLGNRTFDEYLSQNVHTRHHRSEGTLLPLLCAAYVGNTIAAQLLLGAGAEKDAIPPGGCASALGIALTQRSVEVAELLLESGASPYHYDCMGNSGISLLACYCPQLFLKHRGSFELDAFPNSKGEALTFQVAFLSNHDNLPAFSNILRHEAGLCGVSLRTESAYQYAFTKTGYAVHTFILNAGIDLEVWDEHYGRSLHAFWINRRVSTLKRLIRRIGYEKSMKLLNRKASNASTPLYQAALMGQQEVAGTLMQFRADVNVDGGMLGTPLMAAAAYGRLCIVKDFVDAGAALWCFSIEENRVRSAVDLVKHFPEIQRWISVGRWTERRRITYEA